MTSSKVALAKTIYSVLVVPIASSVKMVPIYFRAGLVRTCSMAGMGETAVAVAQARIERRPARADA